MAKIYQSVEEFIGRTPLMEVRNIERKYGLEARLLVKLEYMNPAGSVKDRAAKYIIEDAEKAGLLKPGATIVEPTSGNTGIGLASLAAAKGYCLILTMPETMSLERRNILKAYGAKIVLTDGSKGMNGAIEKAKEIVREVPGAFLTGQFDSNPSNAKAHRETRRTRDLAGYGRRSGYFCRGSRHRRTITGTGEYLKRKNPEIRVVAVEPAVSPVLSQGQGGPHEIQGIGAGFIPSVLNTEIYDEIFPVEDEVCFSVAKELAQREGILVGISSGAAMYAALELAKRPENRGRTIVALLPDGGDRYYSTPLFAD